MNLTPAAGPAREPDRMSVSVVLLAVRTQPQPSCPRTQRSGVGNKEHESWVSESLDGRRNKRLENQGGMRRASFFSSKPGTDWHPPA